MSLAGLSRRNLGSSIGLTLVLAGMSRYVSPDHPTVLHRWSHVYFAVLLVLAAIAALLWWRTFRGARSPEVPPRGWPVLVDLAILCWGAASLINAVVIPGLASNLLDANLIGDPVPPAAILSWLGLACLTVAVFLHPAVRRTLGRHSWLVSVAALVVLAVLGEGVARAWSIVDPETEGFPTYRSQIWGLRYVRTNAMGYRDVNHNPASTARRLLVIGDSYAYGVGIDSTADRVGELLAVALDKATGTRWEAYNGALPDKNTLQETAILRRLLPIHPAAVLLLYVFNDMDYLAPITPRPAFLNGPTGVLSRLSPARVLYLNSFLYQELYVRWRHVRYAFGEGDNTPDPYSDSTLVARHLEDVCTFVNLAASHGAVVGVVPFDVTTQLTAASRTRMATFSRQAEQAGIPIWRIDQAFVGHSYRSLVLNPLDGHPNVLANRLAAAAILPRLLPLVSGSTAVRPPVCRSGDGQR